MPRHIQIGKFKAECLHLLAEVNRTQIPLVVTKHNIPLVKISPAVEEKKHFFGRMRGTIKILGDIVEPIGESWDAQN